MVTIDDYRGQATAWCPGCGNFGILQALKKALVDLKLEPHQVLIVSGIGQASKLPHYMKCNTFNGLHGRILPVASGAKIANQELVVIGLGGDGDNYGEGGNHFLHTIRRNIDMTLLVHNNKVYGLTKGQASPTSDSGFISKVQPEGVVSSSFNALSVAISLDASFVSRGWSGDRDHLSWLIKEAVQHKGFSLIDILQPCVTFNKKNTYRWYKERIYELAEEYDPTDRLTAFKKTEEWGDKIPIGIFYRKQKPTFADQLAGLKKGALLRQKLNPSQVIPLLEALC
ncbi:MAG: 2-oxoacid ferredoxin oxidoreductase [Clostridia bacterium]|jgi:2-oxoglutarate ferredoxin oxidoreductase subunit beta|nr:2-oxoacid ferredoxin oxidoreductase [Clostridia bacterium]